MAQALGTVKSGSYGVADLFVEQRKYDKDKSKFFIWRERGHAPLVHVLITKLPKLAVTDPEPKHFEDGYRKFKFTTTVASTSSSGSLNDLFYFSDAEAAEIQPGYLLKVTGGTDNWVNISDAGVVTYGARSATVYTTEEMVEIEEILESAGGNTKVRVRRGIGGTAPTSPPQIGSSVAIYHDGEVVEDGAGSLESFSQNAVVVNNYIQGVSVPYEITEWAKATDIFGENEWQRKARNARKDFARRLQRLFTNGHMYKRTGAGGQNKYYTGGYLEWIPNDADHRVNAGRPISQTWVSSFLRGAFMEGNGEKWGICGFEFVNELANAASDKIRYNEKMSADLGFDVNTFSVAGGGTLHLLTDYELSAASRGRELAILDLPFFQYMYLQGHDIQINTGPNGAGIQLPDEKKTKHEIYGAIGMKRAFKDAHFLAYGFS